MLGKLLNFQIHCQNSSHFKIMLSLAQKYKERDKTEPINIQTQIMGEYKKNTKILG